MEILNILEQIRKHIQTTFGRFPETKTETNPKIFRKTSRHFHDFFWNISRQNKLWKTPNIVFLNFGLWTPDLVNSDCRFGFLIKNYTPYSMNRLFSEFFTKFGGVFLEVCETISGGI